MTEVDITIELTKEEVRDLILEYNVCFGSGIAYTKYKFDILKDSYNVFISYLVSEVILHTGSILIVKGVNSLDEIIVLSEKLKIENLSLRRVLLPSSTRLGQRKSEALTNTRLHSRWIGGSEEEVEQNFAKFMNDLQAIKDAAPQLGYEVIEV